MLGDSVNPVELPTVFFFLILHIPSKRKLEFMQKYL